MKKNEYLAPEMEILEVKLSQHLLGGSINEGSEGENSGTGDAEGF